MTEDETVGWHHQHSGHEVGQTLEDGEGQGSLACSSPWGHEESDMTENILACTHIRNSMERSVYIFSRFLPWYHLTKLWSDITVRISTSTQSKHRTFHQDKDPWSALTTPPAPLKLPSPPPLIPGSHESLLHFYNFVLLVCYRKVTSLQLIKINEKKKNWSFPSFGWGWMASSV